MKLLVFTVRDRAADVFGQPMFGLSKGGMIRGFADQLNDPQSALAKHPEDYDLFFLGEYDDSNAVFNCAPPQQMAVGKDLVIKQKG